MSVDGYFENYCLECDWSASTENYERDELLDLAVEHSVETDHDIDSWEPSDAEQRSASAASDDPSAGTRSDH